MSSLEKFNEIKLAKISKKYMKQVPEKGSRIDKDSPQYHIATMTAQVMKDSKDNRAKSKELYTEYFQQYPPYIFEKLQKLDMKFTDACTESTHQKVLLLHTALRARTLFGLDMSTSFFFRGSTFQTKFINVLGINDKALNEF